MSTMLDNTMDTAKNAIGSAKDGTQHAVMSARGALFDGIRTAASVVSLVRSFGFEDALGWVGLARRRGPMSSIALFGAGFAAGAGAGLLFAPMSGADMRKAILDRIKGLEQKTEAGARDLEEKAEELAGKAKDKVKSAERKIENKVSEGAEIAKDAIRSTAESAGNVVKGAVEEAKTALSDADMLRHPDRTTDKIRSSEVSNNHRPVQNRHQ